MIGSALFGFIVAMIAAAITNRGEKMGCIGKILLGLAGAWVGQLLFGDWGPQIADTAIIPSVLGAVILLAIFWERGS
ncbi:GlsB/YeaQ/YmgE family stress response membrane protein [Streptococcus sp. ZJ93]|uniref:GlsB/YeaQ/YmgE family stress response membrane protein n=1 Tax=Streptococcus handemini TaxID=3161188 RepID=UPI0032EB207A